MNAAALQAGFAEVDITPAVGIKKVGWLCDITSTEVADPLYARAAVLASGETRLGIVQLDTLSIGRAYAAEMRARIEREHGLPAAGVMVAATHNHAGPAVTTSGDVEVDTAYMAWLVEQVVGVVGQAVARLEPAEMGIGHAFEWGVSQNRRVVMRDGTTRTHGNFDDPLALYLEGPIDPEVAVMAVRSAAGRPLGAIVNFACHPTHHGGDTVLSAGYPGVLANGLKAAGWPAPLFLNGSCGNIHTADPCRGGADRGMVEVGQTLAADALRVIEGLEYRKEVSLAAGRQTVRLPFRKVDEQQLKGTARGAARFGAAGVYDRTIPRLLKHIEQTGAEEAEVQVLAIGDHRLVGVPCELFVQHGLAIKERAYPAHALVVEAANGMVGYVPHAEAFVRGGYETTFGEGSRLAPEAGEMLVAAAVEVMGGM